MFKKYILALIWLVIIADCLSLLYVNYWLPHGSFYYIDDFVCPYEDFGGNNCYQRQLEDMRFLNIPDWAKFVRRNGEIILFTSIILGIIVYHQGKSTD